MKKITGLASFALSVLFLIMVLVYTAYAIETKPEPEEREVASAEFEVTVVEVSPGPEQASVQAYGEVRAKFELSLRTELPGRIVVLKEDFEAGRVLAENSVVVELDDKSYQQQLAQAKRELAQAKLDLMLERQESEQSQLDWKQSGLTGKVDDLGLRKPQLALAEAKYEQAQALLVVANQNVERTVIRLPFKATIAERLVSPGQFLQGGEAIATLYSTDKLEITVSINSKQWALLGAEGAIGNNSIIGRRVQLLGQGGRQWQGEVDRLAQNLDANTRLRGIVIRVLSPDIEGQLLLPGAFVEVIIPGAKTAGVLALPASSVDSTGDVWFVDSEQRLRNFRAEIIFQKVGTVFVRPPALKPQIVNKSSLNVLLAPLPNYINGQTVQLIRQENKPGDGLNGVEVLSNELNVSNSGSQGK